MMPSFDSVLNTMKERGLFCCGVVCRKCWPHCFGGNPFWNRIGKYGKITCGDMSCFYEVREWFYDFKMLRNFFLHWDSAEFHVGEQRMKLVVNQEKRQRVSEFMEKYPTVESIFTLINNIGIYLCDESTKVYNFNKECRVSPIMKPWR